MSTQQKTIPLRMRLTAIILGMVFLFWLSIEDESEYFAILFSISICSWLAAAFLMQRIKTHPANLHHFIILGTIAGALITPLALFLMAFKTGLHGHPSPDYTAQQILSVIRKTPIWILGGFLISLGSGIWFLNRQSE